MLYRSHKFTFRGSKILRKITVKHLRTGAWLAAGVGILSYFVFHAYESYLFDLLFVSLDILPYFIIAIAATINRTRAMAWITLVASFTVLALGVYVYIDVILTPDNIIYDYHLSTGYALKWWIALIVLVIVISVLYFRGSKIHEEFSNPSD